MMLALILDHDHQTVDGSLSCFSGPPHGTIAERLDVYVAGFPARVQDALEESYPAVAHLIGHSEFHKLVRRYIGSLSQFPSNLNDIGAFLPAFLAFDRANDSFPFLHDLARMEWALVCAFHAPAPSPFDTSHLAAVSEGQWTDAILEFQPAVAVLRSNWPIHTLWAARELPREELDIAVQDQGECVLIRRAGSELHCDKVDANEAVVMEALIAGTPLGRLGELLDRPEARSDEVTRWFARWIQQGLIGNVRLQNSSH